MPKSFTERHQELLGLLDAALREGDTLKANQYRAMVYSSQGILMRNEDYMGDDTNRGVNKRTVPSQIAPYNAYASSSQQFCPHCRSSGNQRLDGNLVVDGSPRPAYVCGSCNKIYSDVSSEAKVLMDAALNEGAETVGYIKAGAGLTSGNGSIDLVTGVNGSSIDAHNYQLDEIKNAITQSHSRFSAMDSNLSNILYAIQNLNTQLQNVTQQNQTLMEKVASDPLLHIRKSVLEFTLK